MYMHTTSVHVCVSVYISCMCVCVNASVNNTVAENICAWIFFQNVKFSFALEDNCVWPTVQTAAPAAGSSGLATTMTPTLTYIHTYIRTYVSAAEHAYVYMYARVCVC